MIDGSSTNSDIDLEIGSDCYYEYVSGEIIRVMGVQF